MISKITECFHRFLTTSQFFLYGKISFTKIGYRIARKKYPHPNILVDPALNLKDRVFIVTGANSGIGREVTRFLASQNATVYMVCRNPEKGKKTRDAIHDETKCNTLYLLLADMGLETGVRSMWKDFIDHRIKKGSEPSLDALVCNAGSLNNVLTLTKEGVEETFATHLLFGTYLLIELALPVLQKTKSARVVVVSSGGMYNTAFPEWNIMTCRKGEFNGQLAYARSKRGQVLLCEKYAEKYPNVIFTSCHPGWVDTPGVESAYGSMKRFLEPLRSVWEGSEGIIWLCVAAAKDLNSGAFYLDRSPRRKHISGLCFTEGSYTKNTQDEIEDMLKRLHRWSNREARPDWPVLGNESSLNKPLEPLHRHISLEKFMGRWYVWANIPTYFDSGTTNNIEEYKLEKNGTISVRFTYKHQNQEGTREIIQKATVSNDYKTKWNLSVKYVVHIPVPLPYLICYIDESYEHTIIGTPNRSYVWIMARSKIVCSDKLATLQDIVESLGYDVAKIVRPPFVPDSGEPM